MKFAKPAIVALVTLSFGYICSHGSPVTASEFSNGAEKFIQSLVNQAVPALSGKSLSDKERQYNFRKILRAYFDVDGIGKWALGRYWRKATKGERSEYLVLFEDLIVGTYANRFKNYSNEKLAVYGTTSRGQVAIVNSHLKQDNQKPIRVDWRVKFPDGKYKIFDIIVEGVSMIQTQRSEFSSVIRRNGGKVSGLLAALRQKSIGSNHN